MDPRILVMIAGFKTILDYEHRKEAFLKKDSGGGMIRTF